MKQIIQIVVFSLSLIVSSINAQTVTSINADELKKLPKGRSLSDYLYIGAGINSSSTVNTIDYDRRPGISFDAGVVLKGGSVPFIKDVPVLSDLRYNIGIGFEQFGSKFSTSDTWDGGEYSNDVKLRFNYLSFPITVEGMLCQAYLLGGLKFRFLLGGTESWKYTSVWYSGDMEYSDSEKGEEDVKDYVKNFDLGFVVGTGMPFQWKNHLFRLEAKYEIGLRNIWDDSDSGSSGSNSSSLKNNSFKLSASYLIPFGK
jgi:hypothetical protein